MGSPASLSDAQLKELQSLSSDLPETNRVVRIGRDGNFSLRIPMRTNDVVLLLLDPS
jgi:xylan 1,4-beta-xylosidase